MTHIFGNVFRIFGGGKSKILHAGAPEPTAERPRKNFYLRLNETEFLVTL